MDLRGADYVRGNGVELENMNNAYANKKCTNNIYINNRYAIEVTRKRMKKHVSSCEGHGWHTISECSLWHE